MILAVRIRDADNRAHIDELNGLQHFNSERRENVLRFHHKDQLVNAVTEITAVSSENKPTSDA